MGSGKVAGAFIEEFSSVSEGLMMRASLDGECDEAREAIEWKEAGYICLYSCLEVEDSTECRKQLVVRALRIVREIIAQMNET